MPRNQYPAGTGGATADGRDNRSGLLDIRALSSVIDAQRRPAPQASASSLALPAFTPHWAAQDLLPKSPPPSSSPSVPAATAPATDNRLLYVMIGALSLSVLSLGAYVALQPPPTRVVKAPVVAPPVVAVDDDHEQKAEPEPEAEPVAAAEPEAEEDEPEAEEQEAEAEPVRRRSRRGKNPRSRTKAEPKATPTPKPKDKGVVSVECVIDPSKCGKTNKPRDPEADTGSTKGLPATPNSTQIRSAMAGVKADAKACGPRHGASAGTKVRIKLSAKGSTGEITSARALEDHAGTALGRCVASALSKAKLPRFSKKQAGIVYAVRM